PTPAPAPEPEEPVDEVSRQLQFEAGRTARFYEIEQSGCKLTITSGRVGRDPKVEVLTFPSPRRAAEQANKLCEAKLEKGYEEF
ncbi:MAG: WGR domain-containing protein, partial [Myxococcales bacterium]|nr:WGR domain-containing protein [Myxococcales bacterium]